MANAMKTDPITGPFPDGDTRNLTLTQSQNAFEPERTGPQEATYRDQDAPDTVIGDLARTELKPGAEAPAVNDSPSWIQIGKGAVANALNLITPGSKDTSVMGDLPGKVSVGPDNDTGNSKTAETADGEPARPYTLEQDAQASAAQTAFGGVGGVISVPLLQEDWNPAERNSDDLSR